MMKRKLTVDIFSVFDVEQLNGCCFEKTEDHTPIPRDTKRQKTGQRTRKSLCMQYRVKRGALENDEKICEFPLL